MKKSVKQSSSFKEYCSPIIIDSMERRELFVLSDLIKIIKERNNRKKMSADRMKMAIVEAYWIGREGIKGEKRPPVFELLSKILKKDVGWNKIEKRNKK